MATAVASPERSEQPRVPKFDDRLKASLAIVANLFLILVVSLIWGVEQLFDKEQIRLLDLFIFVMLTLVLIVYYGAVVTSDKIGALLRLLARAARTGVADEDGYALYDDSDDVGVGHHMLSNLWIPVTFNFLVVGYLIYASGGITNSAYSQVPIAMMLIGQSVYDVPPIELRARRKVPRLLVFIWRVAALYWYPLCLMASLLGGLMALQRYIPLVTKPVPTVEIALTTLLSVLASMCVTFITRRADQASAVKSRLPSIQTTRPRGQSPSPGAGLTEAESTRPA